MKQMKKVFSSSRILLQTIHNSYLKPEGNRIGKAFSEHQLAVTLAHEQINHFFVLSQGNASSESHLSRATSSTTSGELVFWADKEESVNTWILCKRLVESVRRETMRGSKNETNHVAFDGFIPSSHMLRCHIWGITEQETEQAYEIHRQTRKVVS